MNRHILIAGLCAATASLLTVDTAQADHCRCGGGYSIGGCTTPSAPASTGVRYYAGPAASSYYYSPSYYSPGSYYYGGSPSYGYYRPGFSISIGSGFGYRPYGGYNSFGPRYGYGGFGFGSSFSHHHH